MQYNVNKLLHDFNKQQGNLKISLILILIMLLQLFSSTVFAAEDLNAQDISNTAELELEKDYTLKVSTGDKTWLFPKSFLQPPIQGSSRALPEFEQISAANYIVADLDTGEILLEKNIDEIAYPASMTKIMTALTILESPEFDLQKPVIFSENAVTLPSPESVSAGFYPGEQTTTENALYLMMVMSANDCARALAETYGGTEEEFCLMMNQKALELGCENTHLVDSAGFGLEDHYFTPRDLYKIVKKAMENEIFRKLVSTETYASESTNLRTYSGWVLANNTNQLLIQGDTSFYSPYLHSYGGVKTGTTDLAGKCLTATVRTYDGRHLCGIVFNATLTKAPEAPVNAAVLLRAILENAAKSAGAPTADQAYQFLNENPLIAKEVGRYQDPFHITDFYKQFAEVTESNNQAENVEKSELSQDVNANLNVENSAVDPTAIAKKTVSLGQETPNNNIFEATHEIFIKDTIIIILLILVITLIVTIIVVANVKSKRKPVRRSELPRQRPMNR